MKVALDPSLDGMEGQGHRSKSNIKIVFFSLLPERDVKVRGQGHQGQDQMSSSLRSRSEIKVAELKVKFNVCTVKVTKNKVKVVRWSSSTPVDSREVRHVGVFICIANL